MLNSKIQTASLNDEQEMIKITGTSPVDVVKAI